MIGFKVILFAFFVSTAAVAQETSTGPRKTLVFDLDGIALYHVPQDSKGERLITVKSNPSAGGDTAASVDRYRVADGFGELIQHLQERGWRLSVFSFGNETRNRSAAEAIKLPSGKSLLEAVQESGGKIYSNTDGRNLNPKDPRTVIDTSLPKSERPKIVKDLAKVMGAAEARNAFLVEDILSNSAPGQRATHTIYLPYEWVTDASGSEVKFLEQPDGFEGAINRGDLVAAENSIRRFSALRNKLAYLTGLIEEMEARVEAKPGLSYSEALQELQWTKTPSGEYAQNAEGDRILRVDTLDSPSLMREGAGILERLPGSSYEFILPFKLTAPCDVLWRKFDELLRLRQSGA